MVKSTFTPKIVNIPLGRCQKHRHPPSLLLLLDRWTPCFPSSIYSFLSYSLFRSLFFLLPLFQFNSNTIYFLRSRKKYKASVVIIIFFSIFSYSFLFLSFLLSFSSFLSATEFSVADYDSTPYDVVVVVVVVVVSVMVQIKKWITFKRFEISAWFLVYIYIILISFTARNFFEIGWCEPARPAYQPKFYQMG